MKQWVYHPAYGGKPIINSARNSPTEKGAQRSWDQPTACCRSHQEKTDYPRLDQDRRILKHLELIDFHVRLHMSHASWADKANNNMAAEILKRESHQERGKEQGALKGKGTRRWNKCLFTIIKILRILTNSTMFNIVYTYGWIYYVYNLIYYAMLWPWNTKNQWMRWPWHSQADLLLVTTSTQHKT